MELSTYFFVTSIDSKLSSSFKLLRPMQGLKGILQVDFKKGVQGYEDRHGGFGLMILGVGGLELCF